MISTRYNSLILRDTMLSVSEQLQTAQIQSETQKKTQVYSGLGTEAPTDINTHNLAKTVQRYKDNGATIVPQLNTMESTLNQMDTTITEIKAKILSTQGGVVTPTQMQALARDALDQTIGQLNTSLNGRFLYSGYKIQTTPVLTRAAMQVPAPAGPGPVWKVGGMYADTNGDNNPDDLVPLGGDGDNDYITPAVTATMDAAFAAQTYYKGDSGNITAHIDQNQTISYGIRANNPAFETMMKGLYVLEGAVKPTNTASPAYANNLAAYNTWINKAFTDLTSAQDQIHQLQASNGLNQKTVSEVAAQHDTTLVTVTNYIGKLEDVDAYEVTGRVTSLQAQLEASYKITGMLAGLSLAKFL